MKTNDYLKFMTQEVIKRMDEPKEAAVQRRQQRKSEREPRAVKWLGMIPMSVRLWLRKRKGK